MIREALPLRNAGQLRLPNLHANTHEAFVNLAGQHVDVGDVIGAIAVGTLITVGLLSIVRFINRHPDLF